MMYKAMNIYGEDSGYVPLFNYDMEGEVQSFELSEDGKYVLIQTDKIARVFESRTGEIVKELSVAEDWGPEDWAISAVFCGSDAVIVLNAEQEGYIPLGGGSPHSIPELKNDTLLLEVPDAELVLAQNGSVVCGIDAAGKLLYEMDLSKFVKDSNPFFAVQQQDQGKILAEVTGDEKIIVFVFDAENGTIIKTLSERSSDDWAQDYFGIYGNAYYEYVSEHDDEGEATIMLIAGDLKSGKELWRQELQEVWPSGVLVSESGIFLYGSEVSLWDRKKGHRISQYSVDAYISQAWIGEDNNLHYMTTDGRLFAMDDTGVLFEETDSVFQVRPNGEVWDVKRTEDMIAILYEGANYIVGYMEAGSNEAMKLGEDEGILREPDYRWADEDLDGYENVNPELVSEALYSDDGKYILVSYTNGMQQILDTETKSVKKTMTQQKGYENTLWYCAQWGGYVLDCSNGSIVLNEDFEPICDIGYILGSIDDDLIMWDKDYEHCRVPVVRYNELIRMADEYLGDYEPSQEIRQKYDFE